MIGGYHVRLRFWWFWMLGGFHPGAYPLIPITYVDYVQLLLVCIFVLVRVCSLSCFISHVCSLWLGNGWDAPCSSKAVRNLVPVLGWGFQLLDGRSWLSFRAVLLLYPLAVCWSRLFSFVLTGSVPMCSTPLDWCFIRWLRPVWIVWFVIQLSGVVSNLVFLSCGICWASFVSI